MTLLKLHYQRKEKNFENINNYSADLIILNAFAGTNEIYELLKSKEIFDNVWIINKSGDRKSHIKTLINLIIPSTCISEFGLPLNAIKNKYNVINTPKYNKVIASIWQLNKNAELQLYDEGFASYENTTSLESHSTLYGKYFKYFNNGKTFYDYTKYYLNKIDMAVKINDKHIEIPLTEDSIEWLKKVFKKIKNSKSKKIYWFDQYYKQKDRKFTISKSLSILERYKENVLFCPHPRKPLESNIFENQKEKSLWEINVLNNANINELCLMTFNSTACLSPKILFDYEPYVIMTYSLLNDNKNIDNYVVKAKKLYKDKNKVMTPRSETELLDNINSII